MSQTRYPNATDFSDEEIHAVFAKLKPGKSISTTYLNKELCGRDIGGMGSRLGALVTRGLLFRYTESGTNWYCLATDKQNPHNEVNKLRDQFAVSVLPAVYERLSGDSRFHLDDMGAIAYKLADAAIQARMNKENA